MPNIIISAVRGRSPQQKKDLLESARRALIGAFVYRGKGLSVRIQEFDAEDFILPPGRSEAYLVVEVTCFTGRTQEHRNAFYRELAKELESTGENSKECLMIVRELPLAYWGMSGGICATELFQS